MLTPDPPIAFAEAAGEAGDVGVVETHDAVGVLTGESGAVAADAVGEDGFISGFGEKGGGYASADAPGQGEVADGAVKLFLQIRF